MVVTPELVAAYSLCPRKAFLMLRGDQAEDLHEYVSVINQIAADSRDRFVDSIDDAEVHRSRQPQNDWNASVMIDTSVVTGDLAAHIQVLLRRDTGRTKAKAEFEPHAFIGIGSVSDADKLRLAFMGKIVAEVSNRPCSGGTAVTPDGKSQRIVFVPLASQLNQILDVLRSWVGTRPDELPVILNNHCPICPFRTQCVSKAEREDNLTLLDRMTPSPEASGLRSIAWRYQWEATKEARFKEQLVAYNLDDCHALRRLVSELRSLGEAATSRLDVDFPDRPKQNATPSGTSIHESLEGILKSAHATYEERRIRIRRKRQRQSRKPLKLQASISCRQPIRARRVVNVRPRRKCPHHAGRDLKPSKRIISEHVLIDLQFNASGCKKMVTKYRGPMAWCSQCRRLHSPPRINRMVGQFYGHSFKAWAVYQRVVLRLPYRVISQAFDDQFRVHVNASSVARFLSKLAGHYASTEKAQFKRILSSPFIHVDETKLNIQGTDHYVWVLTDGSHVAFKLTETREATLLQTMLDDYAGVLVTDFYGGYDAFKCRQQKCLVHLIRDLNDDLWKNPFNLELEGFVGTVNELLVPIMDDVHRFGLKRHFLKKHERSVDRFYKNAVDGLRYECEITERFQKRFIRYRESLFRFLTEDGIPWNNNMGERAIRHLAVQRKISGSFFKRVAPHYLRLLAINQTCRFQEKSFLRFLLSGKKDVDQFKERRRKKSSRAVPSHQDEE